MPQELKTKEGCLYKINIETQTLLQKCQITALSQELRNRCNYNCANAFFFGILGKSNTDSKFYERLSYTMRRKIQFYIKPIYRSLSMDRSSYRLPYLFWQKTGFQNRRALLSEFELCVRISQIIRKYWQHSSDNRLIRDKKYLGN
jgi:hypothetical protein